MAATGKTPIFLYGSTTATNTPSAGNLTNSSDGCEIAINVADKNLFFKDSTNVVNTVPIRQSSGSSNGWISSADWTTFNSKQAALVSGTNIKTVNGTTLLGSGDLGTIGVAYGGTGLTSLTASRIPYGNGTGAFNSSANFLFDGSNLVVGTPTARGVGTFAQDSLTGIGVEVSNLSTANNTTKYMRYVFSGYDTVGTYKQTGFIKNLPADANWTAASIAIETRTGDVTSEKARFWGSGGVSIGNTTDPGAANLSVSGTVTGATHLTNTAASMGYTTGAGGTVTQATNKSTSVTLNKPCGQITMNNAALAAGAQVRFFVGNSTVGLYDVVSISLKDGFSDSAYNIWTSVANGAFYVNVKNISAGSLSEAIVLNFVVIKSAIS